MAKLTREGREMRDRSVESYRNPVEHVPPAAMHCDFSITREKVLQELRELQSKLPFTQLMRFQ